MMRRNRRAWQNSCLACLLFCSCRQGGTHTNLHVCFQLLFLLTERWKRHREREREERERLSGLLRCLIIFYTLSFPNNIWSCVIDAVLMYSLLFSAAVGTLLSSFFLFFFFFVSPADRWNKDFWHNQHNLMNSHTVRNCDALYSSHALSNISALVCLPRCISSHLRPTASKLFFFFF